MIVVTTPTGQIGGQVLKRLVAEDAPIRVVVRDAARLPVALRERVEVVEGSHGDPEVAAKAFDGARAVFWLTPPDPRAPSLESAYLDFTRPACEALRVQRVERVVGISALGRGTPLADNAGHVTASLAMDDLIGSTGVNYRALTMPSFMDNVLRQAELIKTQGTFTSPIRGDRRMPACAVRDIASVAADLLLDESWSGVGEVPVLGPEDISFDEMAQIMTEVLGRPVRFQQVPGEAFKERMTRFGASEAMAQGLLDMALAKDAGLDNAVARTPQTSTPTSFRQWCQDTLLPAVTGRSAEGADS
ncbi:NmrA family NAD(P)-binding protein [Nonomuraea aurantiaca]|uniref:NmrA family NAD(P)-binding protein n=1 Tax=Nonomuraea aurantiaca TaxID=2878562 RepID=UPI001CD9E051|nr:NAD(P)H-binding protein [Nonomuraea aurantiaca]MCA2228426.1 NAD(P)H-binding protein [Nonomuraea aurantiaca]